MYPYWFITWDKCIMQDVKYDENVEKGLEMISVPTD